MLRYMANRKELFSRKVIWAVETITMGAVL
jgi:hypothetical protein